MRKVIAYEHDGDFYATPEEVRNVIIKRNLIRISNGFDARCLMNELAYNDDFRQRFIAILQTEIPVEEATDGTNKK